MTGSHDDRLLTAAAAAQGRSMAAKESAGRVNESDGGRRKWMGAVAQILVRVVAQAEQK